MKEKMITARIKFIRKNWPTIIIANVNIAPNMGISTSIKFISC